MGIFDFFSGQDAQNAANAQISGIQAGQSNATSAINQGSNALTTNYTAALQPFLQNYGTANAGVNQLTNLLGITGSPTGAVGSSPSGGPVPPMMSGAPAGAAGAGPGASAPGSILNTLQNTPGYQFQLQQGDNAIDAYRAATGSLASGNTLLDLSKFNQGLAGTTYQNAVSNLMPFLSSSNTNAGGIANTYTGLGQGLNANQGSLANLNYTAATGQGNAQANADLANYQASGNLWNTVGNLFGGAAKLFGGSGGSIGPTSIGGAPLSGGLLGGIFSDVNLKENIEPVGELYDGTSVYRYNYIGDEVPRIGVMAQEVERSRPDAVVEIGGFKAVDYQKATDLAASLAKFIDGNFPQSNADAFRDGATVFKLDDFRAAPKTSTSHVDTLARFLEAA